PACEVYGGDGGIGVLPDGGYFDSDYWFFFDWVWSFDNFMQNFDVENYGFGPGGGGSIASLAVLDPSNGQSLVTYDIGRGVDLAGDPSVMYGQGSDIFAVNMLGTTPYVRPSSSAGLACSWTCGSSYTHAFGAGGGGAVGNSSLAGASDPLDFGAQAANGDNGIVIVLFDFPIDSDGDGFLSDVDCDDSAPTVNPGATELVGNGYDDDCNAETPIGSDTTLTCDIAPVSTNAVENDFLDLNFTGSNDLGEYATTGDVIGYTSVAAIGGPALATGTLSNLSGSSPTWTATLTVSDTTGISAGDGVTARNGVGDLGAGNVVTVSSVDDGTTLQLTIEGYTDPIEGDVTTIRTGTLVDARLTISDHVTPDNFDIEIVDESSEDGDLNATVSSQLYAYNSLDGTIANVAGAGPWTGEIQGLASTDGFNVGDRFIAGDAYGGWLPGTGGIYTVTGITDTTTITFSAEGGTAPQDGYISGIHSWTSVEYTFDFFEGGSDFVTPIDLNDVSVVVKDVDENQFVEFARPDSIRLEHDSAIEVLSGASSDLVPANNYRFWSAPRSVDTDTPHWVEVSYNTVSSMKVRIGELASGGMSMELAFGPANFTDPITCGTTIIDEVPTTTTYTGDSGRILEGTSMDLSATVDPAECTTPAVTFELTYPDGTTETITDPLDTTGFEPGDYQITASYAGDGTCLPSEDTADFYIPYQTVTTYTGGNGLITAGTSVSLSATVTPAECTSPAVTYTITYPDGTSYPASSPLNTSGFGPGIYEIVADYAGDDAACLPSADSTLLVIATPGDSTTGGGIYHVDSGISGTPRINFGFTVQRTVKTDKRTGSTEEIQRGQLLWMNTNQWRLKASLYSRRVTSSGITTGDTPVFGTNPCPVGVGVSGSNPKCGVIVGRGWLERWNSDTLEWEVATDLGRSGWVSFTATIYDGGSVKVCKGKTCSIVDVADWFGMTMAGITTSTGVPVSVPIQVRKQQNGAIVIRV
ncbi:MAG: MopE-related protein, partial [Ilumatobacteraceae bacterium]